MAIERIVLKTNDQSANLSAKLGITTEDQPVLFISVEEEKLTTLEGLLFRNFCGLINNDKYDVKIKLDLAINNDDGGKKIYVISFIPTLIEEETKPELPTEETPPVA